MQTGNGFIKVAKEENGDDDLYDLRLQIGADGRYRDHIVKSNPATNDWIPSSGDCYDQVQITTPSLLIDHLMITLYGFLMN